MFLIFLQQSKSKLKEEKSIGDRREKKTTTLELKSELFKVVRIVDQQIGNLLETHMSQEELDVVNTANKQLRAKHPRDNPPKHPPSD